MHTPSTVPLRQDLDPFGETEPVPYLLPFAFAKVPSQLTSLLSNAFWESESAPVLPAPQEEARIAAALLLFTGRK